KARPNSQSDFPDASVLSLGSLVMCPSSVQWLMLFIADVLLVWWLWKRLASCGARRGRRAGQGTRRRQVGAVGRRARRRDPGSAPAGARAPSALPSGTCGVTSLHCWSPHRPDPIRSRRAERAEGTGERDEVSEERQGDLTDLVPRRVPRHG